MDIRIKQKYSEIVVEMVHLLYRRDYCDIWKTVKRLELRPQHALMYSLLKWMMFLQFNSTQGHS